jgi:hypothetical protein
MPNENEWLWYLFEEYKEIIRKMIQPLQDFLQLVKTYETVMKLEPQTEVETISNLEVQPNILEIREVLLKNKKEMM